MALPLRNLLPSTQTLLERGLPQLGALCGALEFGPNQSDVYAIFRALLSGWGDRVVGQRPPFASDIGDDHSPFEFSVAFGGRMPELRILAEAQGDPPGLRTNQTEARDLTHELASWYDLSLERFERLSDLFLPTEPQGAFSLWHAVCCYPDAPTAVKIYFNPAVQGRARSPEIVREAMSRLGFRRAWKTIEEIAGHRGFERDVLAFLSLDLNSGPSARLKIYFRHYDVGVDELERSFSAARNHRPGDIRDFCDAIARGRGPFRSKPVGSCFSFLEGDEDSPSRVTLHFPVASYVDNDGLVRERVTSWLPTLGLDPEPYRRVIRAFAHRTLESGAGMQSYVSFRREAAGPRVTVYLSPELYSGPAGHRPSTRPPAPKEAP
ncbi:MAG: hypothetical protein HOW73_41715 [Polyangiaceae bacterium]|nr:hypothetical protein [Polyangiaceae bacterium]